MARPGMSPCFETALPKKNEVMNLALGPGMLVPQVEALLASYGGPGRWPCTPFLGHGALSIATVRPLISHLSGGMKTLRGDQMKPSSHS